jgi:alkylation response protein AidB-like acyl-CoA dehydrogenase
MPIDPSSMTPDAARPASAAAPSGLARAGQAFEALILEKMLAAVAPEEGADSNWQSFGTRAVAEELSRASPLGLALFVEKLK